MRNFVFCLFIGLGLCSCSPKKSSSFTIEGMIKNVKDSTAISLYYLVLNNNDQWKEISDTTYLKNNKFQFSGSINGLTAATLVFIDDRMEIPIYIEPVAIKLVIDKNNPYAYTLSGTSVEKESIELRNILSVNANIANQLSDSVNEIFDQINLHENEPRLVDSLMQKVYQLKAVFAINVKELDSLQLDFINKHKDYQIIPDLIYTLAKGSVYLNSNDSIISIYNSLPESSKTSLLGKLAFEQIKQAERVVNRKDISIGDMAPDFSRENIHGDTIRLADFRGSYVLLDFWASWCGPCIKGIPEIKNIHNKFANKNLKIIGISLDDNKEDWLKAVNEHQIGMWSQVLGNYTLDNSYFRDEKDLSEIYNVRGIPEYIFIDKECKVIAIWHQIDKEQLSEIDRVLKGNASNLH